MKNELDKKKLGIAIFFLLILLPEAMEAQCAMCRAVLESGGDQDTAEGINNGIVYLMAVPYILVGVLFYFVYKRLKG
ncbi:MAG: hypothetical protein AAFX53_02325 [Bacteroidota bacterium]